MTVKRFIVGSGISVLLSIIGFANAEEAKYQDHLTVDQLTNISASDLNKEQFKGFTTEASPFDTDHRTAAVKEAAMVVGSQHGYISRMNKLKSMIKSIEPQMDALWDFGLVMKLANGNQNGRFLIPPIISEVNNVKTLSEDASVITIKGKHLKIVRPERLSLMPINWRSYLIYDEPVDAALPPSDLFPEPGNATEQKAWNDAIAKGWIRGAKHAEKEMAYRMMRMGQDFNGILAYVRMVLSGKMEETIVSYSEEDVVGGGKELIENQETYKIAVTAKFNGNPENWKPFILSSRDSLTFPIEDGSYEDPMEN